MSAAQPPLRVIIADDEAPARSRLRDLLHDCSTDQPLEIVGEAGNGRELLDLLAACGCDLVLLDIRMPEVDGIEAALHIHKLAQPPAIVFTTAYDVYAVKAFELNAVDYLLKPIRQHRLADALARSRSAAAPVPDTLHRLQAGPRRHLSVQERGKLLLVPVDHILYLRAGQKYVTARTAEREFLLEESLTRLEEEFGARFVRIHRSCLVARDRVDGFERTEDAAESGWSVILRGLGERLPVSRRQQHVIRELTRR